MANDVSKKVDAILNAWQRGFTALQKKQELGEKVTDDDVRAVLVEVGRGLQDSRLSVRDVEANGYKVDEFLKVTSKIPGYKDGSAPSEPSVREQENITPATSDVTGDLQSDGAEELEISHEEFTLLKTKPASVAFGHVIQPLREETLVSLRHEDDDKLTPEQEIEQKAYESARALIEKLAPPESMTTAVAAPSANEEIVSQVMTEELSDKLFKKPSMIKKKDSANVGAAAGGDLTDFNQVPVKIIQPSVIRKETRDQLGPL